MQIINQKFQMQMKILLKAVEEKDETITET
jgi:hypothetical protein